MVISDAFDSLSMLTVAVILAALQLVLSKTGITWCEAASFSQWLNLIYAVCSGMFCITCCAVLYSEEFWSVSGSPFWCAVLPAAMSPFFQIYYLSKIWEYIDIFLVMLMGYPINLHFRFHHNTTILLGWFIMWQRPASGLLFMILNTFQHFWVYLYFGNVRNGIVFGMTRIFGHVQLIAGIAVSALSIRSTLYAPVNEVIVTSGLNATVSALCNTLGFELQQAFSSHAWTQGQNAVERVPPSLAGSALSPACGEAGLLSEVVILGLCSAYLVLFRLEISDEDKAARKRLQRDGKSS